LYVITDARGVPVSPGIPPIVKWAVIIGVVVIFFILGTAIGTSNYHHVWPSSDTTKIQLG